jgi:hypothetical protein
MARGRKVVKREYQLELDDTMDNMAGMFGEIDATVNPQAVCTLQRTGIRRRIGMLREQQHLQQAPGDIFDT